MPICTFFGHRRIYRSIEGALREAIVDMIENKGVREFYFGCEGDFDRTVKKVLTELQKTYAYIKITAVLAYLDKKYDDLPDSIFPDVLEGVPLRFAIDRRNKAMVDMSDYVIAYVDTSYGGAYNALEYASRKGKTIINIAK